MKKSKELLKCPFCKIELKCSSIVYKKTKCKKCKNYFFFIKKPEVFFALS